LRIGVKIHRRLLIKTSNLFLFNSETGKIDHGDLKDSDFEGDGQPEIAAKPEVLISSTRLLAESENFK